MLIMKPDKYPHLGAVLDGVTLVYDRVKGKEVKKTLTDHLPDFEI